ncbi:hypothetical protein Tco_1220339 [Tanacetum coccineum]
MCPKQILLRVSMNLGEIVIDLCDDHQYNRINMEMYSDVNVELKDTKLEENVNKEVTVKTLGNVDHSSAINAAIKSEVPTIVKKIVKEQFHGPSSVIEVLQQQ